MMSAVFRPFTSLAAAALLFATGCATAGSSPTAAGDGSVHPGQFVWRDLVSTDTSAARRFYGALLGWEFDEAERNGRTYLIARDAGGPFAGIVDIAAEENVGSHWVSYVSVPDVDKAAAAFESAGGKVLVAPLDTDGARAAVVADPQGAPLGLVRLNGGDPTVPASPRTGRFFWTEYLAADAKQALDFYEQQFGYQSESTDTGLGLEYFVLRRDRADAGLLQIPDNASQNVRPNWLPYVLVDDPAPLVAKVSGLGGQVLLEPTLERRKSTLAIVADPSGGVVALQKYPF
jgi:predicted enzyme related to lactoylglutathione lyase